MWELKALPINQDVESKKVLKRLPAAHRALAELKGIAATIPNESILINTLILQEAKDSSEIENIITTHDELYRAQVNPKQIKNYSTKEVQNYISALKRGYELCLENKLLTCSHILQIQECLENNSAGYRQLPGTSLKNESTGETVYVPPQDKTEIKQLMKNLEIYINSGTKYELDPLVQMAIIHHQFESIHPFYDGNGRTGRIINILYLILNNLLHIPILYLSKYIIRHKNKYYTLIQDVRNTNNWEDWILFIIEAVEQTALETIGLVKEIKLLMMDMKKELRERYKFYSQDLLNNLFKHPYTKISYLESDLNISRPTASSYINTLANDGILIKQKVGTSNFYINHRLYNILVKD